MRLIKGLILLTACAGTLALLFASRARPRALTAIDRLRPEMQFAYVRVSGVVIAAPYIDPAGETLTFLLRDQTGDLRISAYRAVARALRDNAPQPGDRVTVEGTLRVREDEPALVIGAAAALSITRDPPAVIELAALDALAVGDRVQVLGQVRRIRGNGLKIAQLRAGSASADMPLPPGVPALEPGAWLSVTGAVGEYRGAKQILPVTIVPAAPPPIETRAITSLSADLQGQWLSVAGSVADLRPLKDGMRITLQDAQGEIDAVLFGDLWRHLPFSATLAAGDALTVSGVLQSYRGAVEILPEIAADIVPAR